MRRAHLAGTLLLPLSSLGQDCILERLFADDDRKRRLVGELSDLSVVPDCEPSQERHDVLRLGRPLALLAPRRSHSLRRLRAAITSQESFHRREHGKSEAVLPKPLGQAALSTDRWVDDVM